MRLSSLLVRLTFILQTLSATYGTENYLDYRDNLWREIDENCSKKIPIDIALDKEQSVANHRIEITLENFDDSEAIRIDQCRRFSEVFLHKAKLIDHFHRDAKNLEALRFLYCKNQCKKHLPDDDMMEGMLRVKHLADFCHFSKILVIPHVDFEKMRREEMLERQVDLETELFSVEEINNSSAERGVQHLKTFIKLTDNHKLKVDMKHSCYQLYKKIDKSRFDNHAIQYESDNNYFSTPFHNSLPAGPEDDNKRNKKRVVVIVVSSLSGLVFLIAIGVVIYCVISRKRLAEKKKREKRKDLFLI